MHTYVGRHAGAHIEDKIIGAKQFVKIYSPWISAQYVRILEKLVDRKVAVKIITSDKPDFVNQNNEDTGESTLSILRDIKKSQKDVLELDIKKLSTVPISYRIVRGPFIHAKLYIVDGTYAVGGSANFTNYGQSKNVEHIFFTDAKEEVRALDEDYERLWSSYTDFEIIEDSASVITDKARQLIKGAKNLSKRF
jgi:phosphatidylserine/phosphatidylglycerophosphate/cardiolipin synthase-like enzyme